jgi:hypothetical protein
MASGVCPKCGAIDGIVLGAQGETISCNNCEKIAAEAQEASERNVRKDKIDENALLNAERLSTKDAIDLGAKIAGVAIAAAALFKSSENKDAAREPAQEGSATDLEEKRNALKDVTLSRSFPRRLGPLLNFLSEGSEAGGFVEFSELEAGGFGDGMRLRVNLAKLRDALDKYSNSKEGIQQQWHFTLSRSNRGGVRITCSKGIYDPSLAFWHEHFRSKDAPVAVVCSKPVFFTDTAGMIFSFRDVIAADDDRYLLEDLRHRHPSAFSSNLMISKSYLL